MSRLKFFVLIVSILMSCGKSDEPYTIEMKDGVNYIHNHSSVWGDEPKVALEFVKEIGDHESDDENYYFFRPADIARDADGNYYVSESGTSCIKVFEPGGKYKMTIGRRGQGPGEISSAGRIDISAEGNIYVVDAGNYRIQVFSPNGKDLGSIRLFPWPMSFCLLSTGEMVFRKVFLTPKPSDDQIGWARIIDPSGNTLKDFVKPNDIDNELLKFAKRSFNLAVDSEDNIYVAFPPLNRVDKYDSKGNIIFKTDRPLKYKAGAKIKIKVKRGDQIRVIDDINLVSDYIEVDYKDRVWVFSYARKLKDFEDVTDPNEELYYSRYEFHIFDKNGIFLGKIPVEVFCYKFRIFGDRLYFIDTYEDMCIYEYKIVEK